MKLDQTEVRVAYNGLSWFKRGWALSGRPVPAPVNDLLARLDVHRRLSSPRHENNGAVAESESWVGTKWAAGALGWSERKVQRRVSDLGGVKVGDRLRFRESAIRQYREDEDDDEGTST